MAPITKHITTRHPLKKLVATQHLLQSSLLHNTYYEAHFYMVPITRPIVTRHPLQSLLLHGTHNQTLEDSRVTTKQHINLLKICIIQFMNQAYEP